MKVLITGGAGFIGSHTADLLIKKGMDVTVLDNLDSQVHTNNKWPKYLNKKVKKKFGDVRNKALLDSILPKFDAVLHLAAKVGVGQSMYEIDKYVNVNSTGTAILLQSIIDSKKKLKKLVVASSMSIYGEGNYKCQVHGEFSGYYRSKQQLLKRDWEIRCPKCKRIARPIGINEEKKLDSSSVYAITKKDQEELSLNIGQAYEIPVIALRYFNVYGTRQALSNPYTGVVAIFSSRILNGKPPVIFEDGLQTRDFISVYDIANANYKALISKKDLGYYNVGTGRKTSVLQISKIIQKKLNKKTGHIIKNQFRKGDIRHCFSKISKIKKAIKWQPKVKLEKGMEELIQWLKETKALDRVNKAVEELKIRKLTI